MIKIGNDNLTAVFDEKDGMTCTSINFKGREYVYFDEKRKESGGTYGIPILFPTPNRVRDGFYVYNGKKIVGNRHGRLRHMPFEITGIKDDEVISLARFSSADDDFPYDADFVLSLKVVESSLIWNFEVRNKGKEELSYGLALHPYFMKEGCSRLLVNLKKRVDLDDDKYPSGNISDDVSLENDVSLLDEDALFITEGGIDAILGYEKAEMHITASDDFNHAVIYTSPRMNSICVEPQTCLTDAHNMYGRGYKDLASLIILKGKEIHDSIVKISFTEV